MTQKAIVVEKVTLSQQVIDYLIALITTKKLEPGMEIPSEIQLIDELGVSRGVIREAFRSLASLGILDISSGKKPRVKSVCSTALEMIFRYSVVTRQVSARQIIELRCALEMGGVKLAAEHGTEEDFATLRHEMQRIREDFNDPAKFIVHDAAFHVCLAEASKNPLYTLMVRALRAPLEHSIAAGLAAHDMSDHGEMILRLHQNIVDCVCARDPAGAVAAMAEHFDSAVQALLDAADSDSCDAR